MANWIEWVIQLKCKRCGRSSSSYVKAERNAKKIVGCKECHLNTDIIVKETKCKAGDLEISIYIPYYC